MAVENDYPVVLEAMKWVSVTYILWLAYRVAGMRLSVGDLDDAPPGFFAGLIVHPLNPKAWAMITTGFTLFVAADTPPLQATATIAMCLLGLQVLLHPIWTYAGQRIAHAVAGKPAEKYLMWTLAGLTVLSVIYALFGSAGIEKEALI